MQSDKLFASSMTKEEKAFGGTHRIYDVLTERVACTLRLEEAGDSKEDALKCGIEIAMKTLAQAKDLVAGFQVSAPFNKVELALQVIHSC